MKYVASLLVLLATATVAHAQPVAAPASSIGLPLPPIGLPLPVIGLQPGLDPQQFAQPMPLTEEGHPKRPVRPAIVIFGAPYAFGYEDWQRSRHPGMIADPPERHINTAEQAAAEEAATGLLALEVKPADAQVFADGEYVGTLADIEGELELLPGTHRIEIRMRRYEAHAFDVRITAGRTISYRAELTRIEERGPSRPAPPSSPADPPPPDTRPIATTIYLIPGCYLGNVPPEQVKLPGGCDLSKVITNRPRQ